MHLDELHIVSCFTLYCPATVTKKNLRVIVARMSISRISMEIKVNLMHPKIYSSSPKYYILPEYQFRPQPEVPLAYLYRNHVDDNDYE